MKTNKRSVIIGKTRSNPEQIQNIICVPSSWTKPQTYHILIEDGEMDSANYEGEFTAQQVYERFDIEVEEVSPTVVELVRRFPNDQDLGKAIRTIVLNTIIDGN
jgi:hypothetical protein